MIYRGGMVYRNGTIEQLDVEVEKGIITAVTPYLEGEEVTDCTGLLLLPMMADIHTHGCLNIDFTEANTADLARMADYYKSTGVGTFLPTLISSPREAYFEIIERLPDVRLRLEGPFFGTGKKGAHDAACLSLPDREQIEQLGLEHIAMVDVDPAQPGALELIEWLEGQGIRTSVAHTEATYAQTMAAFDRGCRQVTHLFNAMNGLHHRESGVLGAAFDRKDVVVELICDGYHVSPPVVRMAFELYKGRVCVISDSFKTMGVETEGCAKLPDGTIAGAVQSVGQTIFNLHDWGIPMAEAVHAAIDVPYRVLGLEIPTIDIGNKAEFTAFDMKNKIPAWQLPAEM
ncbi:MAG: amidohydrolase family protein [Clostridia bacterium]|nr:amidohydrolase family protein [Clostridia bacterium]